MERRLPIYVWVVSVLLSLCINEIVGRNVIMSTDEMENFINPEDLQMILDYYNKNSTKIQLDEMEITSTTSSPDVGCFGAGSGFVMRAINRVFSFNLRPASSEDIKTHFYFSSRSMSFRVQVHPGKQFGIESVDFNPKRKTVVIIHGFMSYSGADWIINMTRAYLEWDDVNVIAVDWSGGSNTFKYWRAVANTRTVGRDIANFMEQLKNETGFNIKNCHFIGHSLGAQIASFASNALGRVGRITAPTRYLACNIDNSNIVRPEWNSIIRSPLRARARGLDPALPCFNTTSLKDRLDPSDADFVDVIHTNGKLATIGFGFPYPTGHIDFYPNGGIKQPGCFSSRIPLYNTIDQAVCSHGRAYILFIESFRNNNCKFIGSPWDLTVAGINASIEAHCGEDATSCPEMGIRTSRTAKGAFLVITEDKGPYCAFTRFSSCGMVISTIIARRSDRSITTISVRLSKKCHLLPNLIQDITNYLQSITGSVASNGAAAMSSIIPFREAKHLESSTILPLTTTSSSWYRRFLNFIG